jgi:hypothetical protein
MVGCCLLRSRSRSCCGGVVTPPRRSLPSGFSLPPLLLLLLAFDTAPPPPAAITPFAEKEYPSLDSPLHPWHDKHRTSLTGHSAGRTCGTPTSPLPLAPPTPMGAGGDSDNGDDDNEPAFFVALTTPSTTMPLSPPPPERNAAWPSSMPTIRTTAKTTTTPPSLRPSRLTWRQRLHRTPPKRTPRAVLIDLFVVVVRHHRRCHRRWRRCRHRTFASRCPIHHLHHSRRWLVVAFSARPAAYQLNHQSDNVFIFPHLDLF